eukprot:scpid69679/ scgid2316/ 
MAVHATRRRHSFVTSNWLQMLPLVLAGVLWSVLSTGRFTLLASAESNVILPSHTYGEAAATITPPQPQPSAHLQEIVMSGSGEPDPDTGVWENSTNSWRSLGQLQSLAAQQVDDHWPNLPSLSDTASQQVVSRLVNMTLSNVFSQPPGKVPSLHCFLLLLSNGYPSTSS